MMPRGSSGGAGRGGAGRGGGRGRRRIARFIEPALLLLLREEPRHGYTLAEELGRFGFDPATLDPSIVYRALREMEEQGWAASEWDKAGFGPPRRIYRITADGEKYLEWWVADLRRTREQIDRFLETFARQREGA